MLSCVDLCASAAKVEQSLFGGFDMTWKWPSSAKSGVSEEWTGFIDQGVTLEGTLTVKGTFRIDGHVKGNIISEQTVILGDGAKVEGQIEGNRVVISGRFDERFTLRAWSSVRAESSTAAATCWDLRRRLQR